MKHVEERRIVPASALAIAAFCVLVLFELTFFSGIIEKKASTVKKVAPWFLGTFLKLVGEDRTGQAAEAASRVLEKPKETSGVATVAGFAPEELAIEIKMDGEPSSNVVIEPTVPLEDGPSRDVPVPEDKSKPAVDDDVPVG